MKKYKGLLLKDILQSKPVIILITFISLLFGTIYVFQVISSFSGYVDGEEIVSDFEALQTGVLSSSFYIPYLAFVACLVGLTNAELDEKCNFDKFIISSGVKREVIIQEKIIANSLFSLIPLIISLICCVSILFVSNSIVTPLHPLFLFIQSLSNFIILVPLSELLVVFLGSYKAKQFGTLIALLCTLIGVGIQVLYGLFGLDNNLIGALITVVYFVVAVALGFTFYKVALKKYKLRDF